MAIPSFPPVPRIAGKLRCDDRIYYHAATQTLEKIRAKGANSRHGGTNKHDMPCPSAGLNSTRLDSTRQWRLEILRMKINKEDHSPRGLVKSRIPMQIEAANWDGENAVD